MAGDANPKADVIVIGGGLAGLTAVHELKKRDAKLRIVVLEAKGRLGGRTLTVPLKTANGEDHWDLGGQWVSSTQKHLLALLKEFNLETFPQYTSGRKFVQVGDRGVTSYTGAIPSLSLPALLDLEKSFRKMRRIAAEFPVANPYEYPGAEDLDAMTFATYCKNILWTDVAYRLMNIAVEAVYGVASSQISALHLLMNMASAGGFRELVETSLGCAQEMRVKGGTQQISHRLAKSADLVLLGHPVVSIYHVKDMVHVKTLEGKTFVCQKVVMAVPFHLNDRVEFSPPLPIAHQYLCRHLFTGNFIKYVVVYEKAFWREKDCSGEIVNEGYRMDPETNPLDIVYDATSGFGSPALVGFGSAEKSFFWSEKDVSVVCAGETGNT